MKTKILGTIGAVGAPREYTKQDNTKGTAYPVSFQADGQVVEGEFYRSAESFAKLGIGVGIIGNMVFDIRLINKTTKDGRPFVVRDWRYDDFIPANNDANRRVSELNRFDQPLPESPATETATTSGDPLPFD